MSGPIPSDDQLDRIAARVHDRIEARGRALRRAAGTLVVAALVAGGIGLLASGAHPGASGAGTAAGSSASRAASEAPPAVRCHTSPAASSRSVTASAPSDSLADVRAACAAALAAGPTPAAGPEGSAVTGPLVLCRSDGALEAFPPDEHPATLCARNHLVAVGTGVRPHPIGTPAR